HWLIIVLPVLRRPLVVLRSTDRRRQQASRQRVVRAAGVVGTAPRARGAVAPHAPGPSPRSRRRPAGFGSGESRHLRSASSSPHWLRRPHLGRALSARGP